MPTQGRFVLCIVTCPLLRFIRMLYLRRWRRYALRRRRLPDRRQRIDGVHLHRQLGLLEGALEAVQPDQPAVAYQEIPVAEVPVHRDPLAVPLRSIESIGRSLPKASPFANSWQILSMATAGKSSFA